MSPARRDITRCTSRLPRCHCARLPHCAYRLLPPPPPTTPLSVVATLRRYYFAYPVSPPPPPPPPPPRPTARATYERPPSPRPTGLAPRRLGTHSPPPPPLLRSLYLLQCLPHLSLPPSELRLGRVLRRLGRVLTVVQPIGLTVELPSTTHGPSSSRTWTGRAPGRTLLGTPQGLRRRHPRR